MAANNVEDLNFGLGVLEFGRLVNGVFTAYRNVGFIKGTVTITINQEVASFEAGRPQVTLKQEVRRQTGTMRFGLAELNLANLKDLLGGGILTDSVVPVFADGTSIAPLGDLTSSVTAVGVSDTFGFGGNCTLAEVGLRFTQQRRCDTGKRRIVEVWRAQPAGQLAVEFNEQDFSILQGEFTLLADTSRAAGLQLFRTYFER